MQKAISKITILLTLVTLLFIYGAVILFAAPAFTPGQTLDPVSVYPNCGPGLDNLTGDDCTVGTGWTLDLANDYVYNTIDSIGIGTDTPTSLVHIKGSDDSSITEGFLIENNSGDDLLSLANNGSLAVSAIQTPNNGVGIFDINTYSQTLDAGSSSLTGTSYSGITSTLTITGSGDIDDGSAALPGHYAQNVILNNEHIGSVEYAGAFRGVSNHTGSGNIDLMQGLSFNALVNGTGTVNVIQAGQLGVLNFGGTVDEAIAISLTGANSANSGGTIDSAWGMRVTSNDTSPKIEGTSAAYGIHFDQTLGDEATIESPNGDVFGVKIDADSLSGFTSEYGLYVADGENYFLNGLRLGQDSDDYRLEGFNNAGNAELYFGTELVASYTPSDERLKTDINETKLSLDILRDIDIVDFNYDQSIINDGNIQHHGVIAQQLQEVYPNAVKQRRDGYLVVDYANLVPLLIKSMQDTQSQLTDHAVDLIDDVRDLVVRTITADRGEFQDELCVGDTCITEAELIEILEDRNTGSSSLRSSDDDQEENNSEIKENLEEDTKKETDENNKEDEESGGEEDQAEQGVEESNNNIEETETETETENEIDSSIEEVTEENSDKQEEVTDNDNSNEENLAEESGSEDNIEQDQENTKETTPADNTFTESE